MGLQLSTQLAQGLTGACSKATHDGEDRVDAILFDDPIVRAPFG